MQSSGLQGVCFVHHSTSHTMSPRVSKGGGGGWEGGESPRHCTILPSTTWTLARVLTQVWVYLRAYFRSKHVCLPTVCPLSACAPVICNEWKPECHQTVTDSRLLDPAAPGAEPDAYAKTATAACELMGYRSFGTGTTHMVGKLPGVLKGGGYI